MGSQGSGKSTLAALVAENDPTVTFVPSTAREAIKYGYKVNTEADPLSQLLTTVSRITAEKAAVGKTIISDRTPLDSLAYTTYQMDNVWTASEQNDFYYKTSVDLVKQHMGIYDMLLYFPPYFAPVDDGVRSGDIDYQLQIASYMEDYLEAFDLRYYRVPNCSPEERLSWYKTTMLGHTMFAV